MDWCLHILNKIDNEDGYNLLESILLEEAFVDLNMYRSDFDFEINSKYYLLHLLVCEKRQSTSNIVMIPL